MAIRNKTPFYRLSMFRVLMAQAVVTALLVVVCAITLGVVAAYSVFLGSSIALLANAYFTYKAFKYFGARSVSAILQSFWAGQVGKMFMTAVLFALVFIAVKPLNVVQLFLGYILIQLTSVVTLFFSKNL
ncbi:ATP synthase subunit I [Thiopseudomonas sp. CY1220]|uniref:ATP synthase subunit I n=2 Tax=Thiopseudomonas acetoxidans TaxID=3041622 RepID=A0ABT7SPQ2_9GAMM|nr:ATP synthase subunit I [Thiopseudomonas sp. CY1220]MDM7857522.1 ATP synthase subunit I [Thiopseudomonas sp. CY1220]